MAECATNEFEDIDNFEADDNLEKAGVGSGSVRAPKRYLRDVENPLELFTCEEFQQRYRIKKSTVCDVLLPMIETGLEKPTRRGLPISPLFQLLITLRFYATGHFMVDGDLFKVCQGTESRVVKRVSVLLAEHGRNIIKFPDDLTQVQRDFMGIAGCPNVIGCIDGTHIPIKHPGGNHPEVYKNRKGVFSLNVQICCGPNHEICDIVARHPGSTLDMTVFNRCALRIRLQSALLEGIILGDNDYACKTYLLTPNPISAEQTAKEKRYNSAHHQTWKRVKKTLVMWKTRFPCLKRVLGTKLMTTTAIIVATGVLHNIQRRYESTGPDEEESDEDNYTDINSELENADARPKEDAVDLAFRDDFIQRHF